MNELNRSAVVSRAITSARQPVEAAAALLAEAAQIEEHLSERCLAAGLHDKAWSHRF